MESIFFFIIFGSSHIIVSIKQKWTNKERSKKLVKLKEEFPRISHQTLEDPKLDDDV